MKKIITICLLITTTVAVNAQEGKPTKEQTIEYIKNFFQNHSTQKYTKSGRLIVGTKDYSCEINNTTVTIKYKSWASATTYEDSFIQFDLKEIEKIGTGGARFSDGCSHSITFQAYNNNKTISTENGKTEKDEILIYATGVLDCDSDVSHEKIYKAFQHLSKLCGSPKPINFG
ncbi:hypothetical protein PFY12_01635 [Chryseobacterium camelliae]|uniref:DUF4468 domain-containing protein n=1 Tax=Chryseobacterium camelliae TaxID=1265445 RepID=A0ABY7QNB4_9FLAO|nr:hypothetical protein [Chryseobacterium camelliae]WBV60834.1 hypothetical protein PFY12_01635 [Chryseobacterium camelliae]